MKKNIITNWKKLTTLLIVISMFFVSSTLAISTALADNPWGPPDDYDPNKDEHAAYLLTTDIEPPDSGTILLPDPYSPSGHYAANTTIEATAVPNSGYAFDHWSGDVESTNATIEIFMDSPKHICAHFIVDNNDPIVDFTFSPLNPLVGETVLFDASASHGTEGREIVEYSWSYVNADRSFLPENMGTGVTIEYAWESPGVYAIMLDVVDNEGYSNSTHRRIIVEEETFTPILAYNPDRFNFGEIEAGEIIEGNFKVYNAGEGLLNFEIFLSEEIKMNFNENFGINPLTGVSTGPNDMVHVDFWVDTTGFEPGHYEGCVEIVSNGGDDVICGGFDILDTIHNKPGSEFTLKLYKGWNFITIPVQNEYTAQTLGENINGCECVTEFDASTQTHLTHVVGEIWDDFPIEDGVGYYVYVTADTTFTVTGEPLTYSDPIIVDLYTGDNYLGWFKSEPVTASALISDIDNCVELMMYDNLAKNFIKYPGEDFIIEKGMGIAVKITDDELSDPAVASPTDIYEDDDVDDGYGDPIQDDDGDDNGTPGTVFPIILPEEDDKIPDTYKAEPEEEENNDQGDSQAEKSAFLRMLDRFLEILRRLFILS